MIEFAVKIEDKKELPSKMGVVENYYAKFHHCNVIVVQCTKDSDAEVEYQTRGRMIDKAPFQRQFLQASPWYSHE